jgi:quercetin dioxygenase-like cupin family protein
MVRVYEEGSPLKTQELNPDQAPAMRSRVECFGARSLPMSDEVRIGSLRLKFLIDDADNGGKLTMFEMNVPEQAKVPVAHYHRDFEEVWYGLRGVLTVTLDGVAHKLKSGDALFVPRGAVHRFDNFDAGDARALITLTPATAGKRYFEDVAAVINAGGPPDMTKVKAVMERYGLIAA